MPKEPPGKTVAVADEMIANKGIDKTPGKGTRDEGAVTPIYNVLSPAERAEKMTNLKHRITAAGSRCNDGMQAVKIQTLLKKPEDVHWVFTLILDVASTAVTNWAISSLTKFKTGKINDYATRSYDAVQRGHYDKADQADSRAAIFASVSDESIKHRIGLIGGLAKTQAKPVMAAALADTRDKAEDLSYVGQLQQAMDLAFQRLNEEGTKNLTDAELLVLFDAMDIIHHSSEHYEKAITKRITKFKESGVNSLGKARTIGGIADPLRHYESVGDIEREKRVVWVMHPDGQRSLWYYESAGSHTNARSHELALKQGMDDKFRLTKAVPKDFEQEADFRNEAETGKPTEVLPDSPTTRKALGIAADYVARMNAARVNTGQKQQQQQPQDSGAVTVHGANKLFGGM